MSDSKKPEAPLDLMNSGRDELIAGNGPVQVVAADGSNVGAVEAD